MLQIQAFDKRGFEFANSINRNPVEQSFCGHIDDGYLLGNTLRLVLALLQDLDEAFAAPKLVLRRGVEIGAELRERLQLAVLRKVETQRTRHRSHRLDLRAAKIGRASCRERAKSSEVEDLREE